jgi:cell division protein ZapD
MLGGRTAQMVRLRVAQPRPYVPEISANKYALNIRFTTPGTDARPRQADSDVVFEMTFCNL